MHRVTAVVPTWAAGERLEACLDALLEQGHALDRVVVVVTQPGLEVPRRGGVDYVDGGERLHYGAACNRGARGVEGDLLFLNDDTVPARDFVEQLVRARAGHPLAVLQPRILLVSGGVDNAGHGLFFDGFNWARGRDDSDGAAYDGEGTVGAVSGAALSIPSEVLAAIGGFDESLEAFGEDVDLSLRAVRRGVPLRYVPEARIAHHLGASYGRYGWRKVFLVERNRVRVAVRSLPATAVATLPVWTGLRWGALAAASVGGRSWGARLGGRARLAAVAGAMAGVGWVPDALRKRRSDAPSWTLDEAGMWRHLVRERVRARDLFR